jgi:hypothetical protein
MPWWSNQPMEYEATFVFKQSPLQVILPSQMNLIQALASHSSTIRFNNIPNYTQVILIIQDLRIRVYMHFTSLYPCYMIHPSRPPSSHRIRIYMHFTSPHPCYIIHPSRPPTSHRIRVYMHFTSHPCYMIHPSRLPSSHRIRVYMHFTSPHPCYMIHPSRPPSSHRIRVYMHFTSLHPCYMIHLSRLPSSHRNDASRREHKLWKFELRNSLRLLLQSSQVFNPPPPPILFTFKRHQRNTVS